MKEKKISSESRDFKGVFIPKEIWISNEMTGAEKLIFMEIWSLDREFGCVAGNQHFCEFFQLSERQVRDYIKRLKDKGLISVTIDKKDNSRVIKVVGRYARVTDEQIQELG